MPFSDLERKAGGFEGSETKQSRIARANQVAEQLMQLRDDCSEGRLPSDGSENRLLWNVTNRYARRVTITENVSNRKKVTLLLAHANGFPKEVREIFPRIIPTTYDDLYSDMGAVPCAFMPEARKL